MKLLIISLISFCIAFSSSLYSKEKSKPKSKKKTIIEWSDYQGEFDWESAKEKCKSFGMRTPTRSELEDAYKNKNMQTWSTDGAIYWTEEELTPESAFEQFLSFMPIYWTSEAYKETDAYAFHVMSGVTYTTNKLAKTHVRCVRSINR